MDPLIPKAIPIPKRILLAPERDCCLYHGMYRLVGAFTGVGCTERVALGNDDGHNVGIVVGTSLGSLEGSMEGSDVGVTVGAKVAQVEQ